MKKILFLVLAAFSLISCETDQDSALFSPVLVSDGEFVPTSGITVTGSAKVYVDINQRKVVLENFTISEGPDLKVYLSTSAEPNTFINLGDLTAATEYAIPKGTDLKTYTYVLIHCQQYNHLLPLQSRNRK